MNKETIIQGTFKLTDFYFFSESGLWHLVFENNLRVQIECFWRLLENRKIKRTSKDNQQLYGHKTPIDLENEIKAALQDKDLDKIERNTDTGDLYLLFENGLTLEIITDSSGYECWEIINGENSIYGLGQGEKA